MLFAKDFKTALAAVIAAAGLLGFGTAHATVILSHQATVAAASNPVYFAAEAWPGAYAAGSTAGGDVSLDASAVATTTSYTFGTEYRGVDSALFDGERYFVRFELSGGAAFGAGFSGNHPQLTYTSPNAGETVYVGTQRVSGGQTSDTFGVWAFEVDEGDSDDGLSGPASGDIAIDTSLNSGDLTISLHRNHLNTNGIRLPRNQSTISTTCYTMTAKLFDNQSGARRNDEEHELASAKGTMLCFVPTVSASVSAPQELTASVATNFRRFLGSSPTSGRLATANVGVKTMQARGTGTSARMLQILDPADGGPITAADVLKDVEFTLEGSFAYSQPFEFGEFKLGSATMTRHGSDGAAISAAANRTAAGKANTASVRGKVTAPGSVAITVDVSGNDATKATNVYSAIGQGSYTASWEIDQVDPGTGKLAAQDPPEGTGPAGSIARDGTTVRIGYLQAVTSLALSNGDTVGWNQRLVITNHGSAVAEVRLGTFNEEDGVTVSCRTDTRWTCGDDEELIFNIEGGMQMVLRVADMITIEGGGRTAGTMTIAADASQVSVATTHVTLPGGQTDTVRYWPLQ